MGENHFDINNLLFEPDVRDEPVLVAADIKHGQFPHLIHGNPSTPPIVIAGLTRNSGLVDQGIGYCGMDPPGFPDQVRDRLCPRQAHLVRDDKLGINWNLTPIIQLFKHQKVAD